MEQVTEDIFQMIFDSLHITYIPDRSTEQRIRSETASGMAYIRRYCDPGAEFAPGSHFGQLLCDYVLRAEAGALETFAADFAGDITAARIEHEAGAYAEAMGYAET